MKKQKQKTNTFYDDQFVIPQIPKIEGLRESHKYVKERFVSPLFGADVKDEISVPFVVRVIGDKVKKYDAFRDKPILDDEKAKQEHGSKYYEFKSSVINKETRKQVFGVDSYKNQEKEEKVIEEPKKLEEKPSRFYEHTNQAHEKPLESLKQDIESSKTNLPPWMRARNAEMDIEYQDDLTIETHQRPTVKTKFGFENIIDKENHSIEEEYKYEEKPKVREYTQSHTFSRNRDYQLPPISLLRKTNRNLDEQPEWLKRQVQIINQTLIDHAVEGEVAHSKKGPTVTRHEISLEPGVPVKRITAIQDNIMMNLSAKSLRIEAPIPGKPYVGIEVPNDEAEIVSFGNVVDTKEFLEDHENPLKVALGMDIDGTNIYVDIAKMPHGLIAGATSSGKSVCVNTILVSLLLKNKPEDLKLVLIDPKMVELTPYNDLPHLLTPVITDPKMAATALNWVVNQMEERYRKFADTRSRNITSYNENIRRGLIQEEKMPYIVIVIDELNDLMMVAAHDVEDAIQRITQKARAAGIHLLVATQRPTVDVIRGTIKSNIPTRIAFRVASFTDSTTILDGAGAEQLLGRGDMLLKEAERPVRLQGAYISNDEIDSVIDFIKQQREPEYKIKHDELKVKFEAKEREYDEIFVDIARFVVEENQCSINNITKNFEVGFNRAQKNVTHLEELGIVSPQQGTKAREVLVTMDELTEILKKAGLI